MAPAGRAALHPACPLAELFTRSCRCECVGDAHILTRPEWSLFSQRAVLEQRLSSSPLMYLPESQTAGWESRMVLWADGGANTQLAWRRGARPMMIGWRNRFTEEFVPEMIVIQRHNARLLGDRFGPAAVWRAMLRG